MGKAWKWSNYSVRVLFEGSLRKNHPGREAFNYLEVFPNLIEGNMGERSYTCRTQTVLYNRAVPIGTLQARSVRAARGNPLSIRWFN